MTPLDFLSEEFRNVERALFETLRYDYGPERSKDYFDECASRLAEISKALPGIAPTDTPTIAAQMNQLGLLAGWISLIERSHLGEFSWPFADEIRRIAENLLAEKHLKGHDLKPIVHVVSEGRGYRIVNERLTATTSSRRLVVVAFPRTLKHHVLLHTIFGHELGHTALYTVGPGSVLKRQVVRALISSGPLRDLAAMNTWLHDAGAPPEVKAELTRYAQTQGAKFAFTEQLRDSWLVELICDLFGLLLFGPSFLGAHRALLQSMGPSPFHLGLGLPTHPPYAIRHKMLARALFLLHWNIPLSTPAHGTTHEAEKSFVQYISDDPFPPWAAVFDDGQLGAAIAGIQLVFAPNSGLNHSPSSAATVVELVDRLRRGLPPILETFDANGKPTYERVGISQVLYAGWVYWLGRPHLADRMPLGFFDTNGLCDYALLQQRAINDALDAGIV
jgi:hypothetical protein